MKTLVTISCAVCNSNFSVHPYRILEKAKYCSRQCSGASKRRPVTLKCEWCEKVVAISPSRNSRFCSVECRSAAWTGSGSPRYKAGRFKNARGYIEITHPKTGSRVLEHRYIMEQYLGRKLADGEIVHHKNGAKDDNRIDNLELMTHGAHSTMHNLIDTWSRKHDCCIECGKTESQHAGKGYCHRCKSRNYQRAKHGFKPRRPQSGTPRP